MKLTRDQLNKLTILDVEEELYQRLGTKAASVARMNLELEKYKKEYIELIEEQERLEAEKQAAKEEFLNKQRELLEAKEKEEKLKENSDLVNSVRWNNLYDKRTLLSKLGYTVSNPDLWFKELCKNSSQNVIDKELKKFESLDYDIKLIHTKESLSVKLNDLRLERNNMLYSTDWTQAVSDSNLTSEEKKQYRLYRKYLRELPKLIEREQVLDYIVLSFEDWQNNMPIFENYNRI